MIHPKISMDSILLGAIKCALGRLPTIPYDLQKIKTLENFYSPVDPNWENVAGWIELKQGDFSAIGQMERLRQLTVTLGSRQTLDMGNFSFLSQCKNLQHLDVGYTNFTDCALLLQLPSLKTLRLPPKEQLIHLEALDQLPEGVKVAFLASPAPTPVSAAPQSRKQPEGSEQVKAIVSELKQRTAMNCWKLTIQPEDKPSIWDSKIGGLPYWNPELPYPTDHSGEKLLLLAQLNLEQLGTDDPIPQNGILQFFIGPDDLWGMDFDAPDKQENFRVVYHPEPDPNVTLEQVMSLNIPTQETNDYSPVFQEACLMAEPAVCYMGPADIRFQPVFRAAVQAVTGEDIGDQNEYQYLSDPDAFYLYDQLDTTGHRLLGYPYFTQYDPRPEDSPYDTLLFQLDSDMIGKKDFVLWGDCGVGNFFINREDLKRRDFSRVLYNWDCS